jgi:hypothetical protein
MSEPTHGSTPDAKPEHSPDATQPVPSHSTEAIPTSSYSYPRASGQPVEPGSPAGAPAEDVPHGVALADEPADAAPPGRGGRRTGLLIGGIAAALVLGGGAVFAAQQLSGSGAQPAEVLPSDAYAYLRLDIDPSAGQKVAAVRFLNKLPEIRAFESGDARKQLWELATRDSSNDCIAKFDYDKDIAPWLGDRAGVAVRPGGTEDLPNVAVALQVTDDAQAKDTLTRLFACDQGDAADLRMKDGYALITPGGKGDETVAALSKGTLADNATFQADMAALGEQGVLSAWADAVPAFKDLEAMSGESLSTAAMPADFKGRYAAALRFDPGYVELAGILRGAGQSAPPAGNGADLAALPDDTMAALHVSGADQMLDQAWPELEKTIQDLAGASGEDDPIAMIEQQLGLTLPDDLKVVLGRSFTLAMPDQDLSADAPVVGGKIVSSDAQRADEVLGSLEQAAMGTTDMLTRKVDGDTLYLATTPDYVAKLQAGGKLGETDGFKAAVGDVSKANTAFYIHLDKLEKQYLGEMEGTERDVVEAMKAIGMTATSTGKGEGSFSLRLVGN